MSGRSLNPGRLVAVYPRKISRFRYCAYLQQFIRSSNHRKSTSDCSGRPRRIPIVFDEFICLTLSTTDGCIACLNPRRNGEQQLRSDREVFSRRYESMDPEDLSSIMRVKLDEVITTFGELFKCVFCYKGFGILIRDLHKLRLNWPDFAKCMDHPDPLTCLTPFVIGDREIFIEPHHLPKVKAMSDLFCIRMPRLHEEITCEAKGIGDAPCKIHEGENVHHAGVWEYSWSVMEAPAKRAVLEIPYSLLVGGISALVGRHYLCEGCELNIYRSLLYLFEIRGEDYDLLLDEDEEGDPIIFDSLYVCKKADLPYNHKSFSSKDINHFKNFLSSATNEYHIHLEESEKVVRHMMALVAPEIDPKVPLTERRSAADIIGGQNCFLLAMGLILFRRFQSMGEKYKESKASVNGFTYTVLSLMRANFEKAYEKKRGLMDLDRICKEIEEEEPKKEASKSAKKRAKKNRRKERLMNQDENDQNAGNIVQEEEEEPHLDIKEDKMNANEKPITFELVVPEEIIKKEDSHPTKEVEEPKALKDASVEPKALKDATIELKAIKDTCIEPKAAPETIIEPQVIKEPLVESKLLKESLYKPKALEEDKETKEPLKESKALKDATTEPKSYKKSSIEPKASKKSSIEPKTRKRPSVESKNVTKTSIQLKVMKDTSVEPKAVKKSFVESKDLMNCSVEAKEGYEPKDTSAEPKTPKNYSLESKSIKKPPSESKSIKKPPSESKDLKNPSIESKALNKPTKEPLVESNASKDASTEPKAVKKHSIEPKPTKDTSNESKSVKKPSIESKPMKKEPLIELKVRQEPFIKHEHKVHKEEENDFSMEFFQSFSILSFNEALNDLEDPIDSAYCGIPEEDIRNFQESVPDFLLKRKVLRQSLRTQFEELCRRVAKAENA